MRIINGDSAELLKELKPESVDLIVTSPPYDSLRSYDGCKWDFDVFKKVADGCARVICGGGVIVWIVNDATVNGSETGTSFKQALYFKELGLNIHDTMIWHKDTLTFPEINRYSPTFEYMFIFSKGKPKTVNLIRDKKNKWAGAEIHGTSRGVDGKTFRISNEGNIVQPFGVRDNVWNMSGEKNNRTGHPAPFPVAIARDHILSWSNKGDVVLDPFCGSGSAGVACKETDREFIGIEISPKYCEIAKNRINNTAVQMSLF